MNLFKPFKAALRWLIGVEEHDILTPFERKLFSAGDCNWTECVPCEFRECPCEDFAECMLCQTFPSDIEVTFEECTCEDSAECTFTESTEEP